MADPEAGEAEVKAMEVDEDGAKEQDADVELEGQLAGLTLKSRWRGWTLLRRLLAARRLWKGLRRVLRRPVERSDAQGDAICSSAARLRPWRRLGRRTPSRSLRRPLQALDGIAARRRRPLQGPHAEDGGRLLERLGAHVQSLSAQLRSATVAARRGGAAEVELGSKRAREEELEVQRQPSERRRAGGEAAARAEVLQGEEAAGAPTG